MQAVSAGRRGQCAYYQASNALNAQSKAWKSLHSIFLFLNDYIFKTCVFALSVLCSFLSAFKCELACMSLCAIVGMQDDFSGAE